MDEDSTTQESQSQRMLGLGLTLSDDSSKHDRKGHLGLMGKKRYAMQSQDAEQIALVMLKSQKVIFTTAKKLFGAVAIELQAKNLAFQLQYMVKDSCVGVAKNSYVAKDNCALQVKRKKKIILFCVHVASKNICDIFLVKYIILLQ